MSNETLQSNEPQVTREFLAEAVKQIFADPQEFAEKSKNMPTKLVIYLLVLVVCAMIQMIFHNTQVQGGSEGEQDNG